MEIPRHWRLKAQRYRLEGSICPNCSQLIFPPRPVCLDCTSQLAVIAGWKFPEVTTAMCGHDSEPCTTCEIPESVLR